ncbi:MAG: Rho GTPase-activating protein [archaeon]|nr:Rho GTPase-activating protein [archaeon]
MAAHRTRLGGDSPASPRNSQKRHTMQMTPTQLEDLRGTISTTSQTNPTPQAVQIQMSLPQVKVSKPMSIDGSKTVAELRAAFLGSIDPKVLTKVKGPLESLVLFCSTGGFWCLSPSRTVGSYWFTPADALVLVKKKKGKELRIRFDGSVHVIEFLADRATVRGVIQALPKLAIRSYHDYSLCLETEKRVIPIEDPKISISVLGCKPNDTFHFCSPEDRPGQKPSSSSWCSSSSSSSCSSSSSTSSISSGGSLNVLPSRPVSTMSTGSPLLPGAASTPALPSHPPAQQPPALPSSGPPPPPPPLPPALDAPLLVTPPSSAPLIPPPVLSTSSSQPSLSTPLRTSSTPPLGPSATPPPLPSSTPPPPPSSTLFPPPPLSLTLDDDSSSTSKDQQHLPLHAPSPRSLVVQSLGTLPMPSSDTLLSSSLSHQSPRARPVSSMASIGQSIPLSAPTLTVPTSTAGPTAATMKSSTSTTGLQNMQSQMLSRGNSIEGSLDFLPRQRAPSIVQPQEEEAIRKAIHAAIVGSHKDKKAAKKVFDHVASKHPGDSSSSTTITSSASSSPSGSTTTTTTTSSASASASADDKPESRRAKAKAKIGKFLGRRVEAAGLPEKLLRDASDSGNSNSGNGVQAEERKGGFMRRKTMLKSVGGPTSSSSGALADPSWGSAAAATISVPIMFFFIEQLLQFDAPNTEGIFRISGIQERSLHILKTISQHASLEHPSFLSEDEFSVNDVSSAFKAYLRNAPVPLIPFESKVPFTDSLELPEQERAAAQARLIGTLPHAHREGLLLLLKLCRAVARNAEFNRMNPHNIGIVFGPTIMRDREESMSLSQAPADLVEDMIVRLDHILAILSEGLSDAAVVPFSWVSGLPGLELPLFSGELPSTESLHIISLSSSVSSSTSSSTISSAIPLDRFEVSWVSVGDLPRVTLSLLLGNDPQIATFCGLLASSIPNVGSFSLDVSHPPFELPLRQPLLLVIECSLSGSVVLTVSSPFTLEEPAPEPLDLADIFHKLSSPVLAVQSHVASAIPSIDDASLLTFLKDHPDAALSAIRALARALVPQ